VKSDEKYMICNGDEGDPGAYMDRGVLEGDPHSVIEGMMIAATRSARPRLFLHPGGIPARVERIEKAIKACHANGLLGDNILGSSFSFDLEIRLGAGAFVCGEETALIASIEGKRGYPHPRPPYPAVKGLGQTTCINNVETLANLPPILLKGSGLVCRDRPREIQRHQGICRDRKGPAVRLGRSPDGTTIGTLFSELQGADGRKDDQGRSNGRTFGRRDSEGAFRYARELRNFQEARLHYGFRRHVVMDEDDSMVDITKFYLGFCVDESCGKCAPCRIGGTQMLRILARIAEKKGVPEDLENFRKFPRRCRRRRFAASGRNGPNPVLSTLRYFEKEYRALIQEAQSAGV